MIGRAPSEIRFAKNGKLRPRRVTPEFARARAEQLASFTHFLDIPILLVIVSLGALRPSGLTQLVIGVAIPVIAASLLNYIVPRLYPWSSDEVQSSRGVIE